MPRGIKKVKVKRLGIIEPTKEEATEEEITTAKKELENAGKELSDQEMMEIPGEELEANNRISEEVIKSEQQRDSELAKKVSGYRKPVNMFMEFNVYVGIMSSRPARSKLLLNITNISTIKKQLSAHKLEYLIVKCGEEQINMPLESLNVFENIEL